MYVTIQKWGNSHGLRIPKTVMDALGLSTNDQVELIQSGDSLTIRKAEKYRHKSLEERLTSFYGVPVEQLGQVEQPAYDWGGKAGGEVW